MKYKDYYQALGVKPTATLDEIKKAYRKLAHQYHPDVSKDPKGEEKFKEVAEAYSTLKDPEKRAAYDELGHHPAGQEFRPPPNWGSQSAGQGFAGGNAQGFSFDDIDLSDLFASFSGDQQQAQRTATAGQDYELSTDISLEDAHAGSTVELNFTVQEQGQPGQGQVKRVPHTFKTRIPKGVTNGQKLLLRGKGGKGFNGGRDGNLYLTINFIPHRLFRVKDHDLLIDLPISPWEAALGATIKVPTLTGAVNLKIPASTSSGQKLRIAKRGLPKKNEEFGDLFAITQIVLPPKLSEQEQALLKQLSEISTFDPRPNFE